MALQFDNRTASRKVPVKRNTKFFSGEDFDLELNFAKEYGTMNKPRGGGIPRLI